MRQTRRTVLGLLGGGFSAGCLRMADSPSDTSDASDSTPGLDGMEYPPGITDGEVTERIADTHFRALDGAAYTYWTKDRTSEYVREYSYAVDGTESHVTGTQTQRDARIVDGHTVDRELDIELYTTDWFETALTRSSTPARVQYSDVPRQDFIEAPDAQGDFILHARTAEYEPTGTAVHDGEPVIEATATSVSEPRQLPTLSGNTDLESYDGRMLITEDGVVVKSSVTIKFRDASNDEPEVYEMAITDREATTVDRPAWADEATAKAPQFDVAYQDDRSIVRIEHVGGDAVTGTIWVLAWEDGSGRNIGTDIEGGLAPGETVYLTQPRVGHDLVSSRTVPEPGEQLAPYLRVNMYADIIIYRGVIEG